METKQSANSINWKLFAGLILSALFLYLAFRQVDFKKTGEILASADFKYLLPVVFITAAQFIIRAWRWEILLHPLKKTGFQNRLLAILIGFAANCVLPARLGEFIRANSLGQAEKISKSSVFGTIVVERLFDGFILLFVFLIGLLFTELPHEMQNIYINLRRSAVLFFCVFILIIIFILGLRHKTSLFIRMIEKAFFMFSKEMKSRLILIIKNFALGLSPVKGLYSFIIIILWSLFLWLSFLVQIQLIGESIGVTLPFITSFIIMAMLSFGVMIPSAPGYIGTFHLSVQYGFMFFGVSSEEAFSAAILLHASSFLPTILLGVFAFIRMQAIYGKIDISKEAKKKPL